MFAKFKAFFDKIPSSKSNNEKSKLNPNSKANYIKKHNLKELTNFYFLNDTYYLTTTGLIIKTNLYDNTFIPIQCSPKEISDIKKWNPSVFT